MTARITHHIGGKPRKLVPMRHQEVTQPTLVDGGNLRDRLIRSSTRGERSEERPEHLVTTPVRIVLTAIVERNDFPTGVLQA